MSFTIPTKIRAACQNDAARLRWLANLPKALHELSGRWAIQLGPPLDGEEVSCSWVALAVRRDGTKAILKIGVPHMEAEDEIKGLRFWAGNPTVRLLEADDALGAMLLEKCEPGTALRELPENEQDVIIAGLLRQLWRPLPIRHSFRPLATMIEYWSSEALARASEWRDPALVREGLRLMAMLAEPTPAPVLLATDLHAGNVLKAAREPWLVIDPKPFVGDPAYDATQHLLNCEGRLQTAPARTIREFADLLEVDAERVRLWLFARVAVMAGEDPRWEGLARSIKVD